MAHFVTPEERVMRAIFDIRPKSKFSVALTYETLTWLDDIQKKPTEKEFNDALTAFDAQEYARNRQAEYPTIAELTVALYDTDDKADIEAKRAAVKLKYPKPE